MACRASAALRYNNLPGPCAGGAITWPLMHGHRSSRYHHMCQKELAVTNAVARASATRQSHGVKVWPSADGRTPARQGGGAKCLDSSVCQKERAVTDAVVHFVRNKAELRREGCG